MIIFRVQLLLLSISWKKTQKLWNARTLLSNYSNSRWEWNPGRNMLKLPKVQIVRRMFPIELSLSFKSLDRHSAPDRNYFFDVQAWTIMNRWRRNKFSCHCMSLSEGIPNVILLLSSHVLNIPESNMVWTMPCIWISKIFVQTLCNIWETKQKIM